MASDKKGFSSSIGGASGAAPVNSRSLIEGDGRFDKSRAQPNKGVAGANGIFDLGHVPPISKPAVVNSRPGPRGRPGSPPTRG
jgi:hypothetical protein